LRQQGDSHVIIIGPGAMGCLHAALLSRAPNVEVSLLDYRAQRAEQIQQQGIIVEATEGTYTVPVRCSADPTQFSVADLVIVFTKAYDTEAAITRARPLIGPDTAVLTLQNGLGNYQTLQRYVGAEQVLAGTTSSGATLLGVGHVRQAGVGEIVLGSPAGNADLGHQVAPMLEPAASVIRVAEDVDALLWRKALINCAINPLTALTGRGNGELLEIEPLRALMNQVAEEVYAVALAAGIDLAEFAATEAVEQGCKATATNQSSMLQDVMAGRRTEIDYINGAVARVAREHKTIAPLCECLTALVRGHSTQS